MTTKQEWLRYCGLKHASEDRWLRDNIAKLFDVSSPTESQRHLLHLASLHLTLGSLPADARPANDAELRAAGLKEFGPPPPNWEPSGIGGWLIFPIIGLCLAPYFYVKGIAELMGVIQGLDFAAVPDGLKLSVFTELFVNACIMCAWVYAAYALFRKKRIFPRLFSALAVIGMSFVIIDIIVAASVFAVPPTGNDYAAIVKQIVSAIIWVPYMFQSVRVKNTFTRD